MHRHLFLGLCVLAATGCHTFQPARIDDVPVGQSVRIRVTGAFSDSLQSMIGRPDRVFEGLLVERRSTSSLMEIPVQQALQGMRFETLSQRVEIPNAELVEVETKELNRRRTFAAAGLAAAVIGTLIVTQLNKKSGGSSLPGTGGPVDARVSLPTIGFPLGIPWPWGP